MEGSAKFVSLVVLTLSLVVYWYKRPVEDMLQVLSYVLGVYQKIIGHFLFRDYTSVKPQMLASKSTKFRTVGPH